MARHVRDGKAHYERAGITPHPHLIDVATGEIIEVDDDLVRLVGEEAWRLGYRLVNYRLKLFVEGRIPGAQRDPRRSR